MAITSPTQWGDSGPFRSKSLHVEINEICCINYRLIGKYHSVMALYPIVFPSRSASPTFCPEFHYHSQVARRLLVYLFYTVDDCLLHDVSNQKFDRSKLKSTCSNCFQMFSLSIVLVSKNYLNLMIKFKAFESGGFLFKSRFWHNREGILVVDEGAATPSEHCWSALEPGTKPPNTAL